MDDKIERLAEQLHNWYLEATRELQPESYNPNAQKKYSELTDEQKEIDRYIARKIKGSMDAVVVNLTNQFNVELTNLTNRFNEQWINLKIKKEAKNEEEKVQAKKEELH